MNMLKHAFGLAFQIVTLTLAVTTAVSLVWADHREPPQVYLLFDGINDYVEVPSSPELGVADRGQLTVSAWMKPATLYFPSTEQDGYVHWLGKGSRGLPGNQQNWAFRMYSKDTTDQEPERSCPGGPTVSTRENRISFYIFPPTGGGQGIGSYFQYGYSRCDLLPEPIKAGQWIHVVGVADGQRTHIFMNGVRMDSDDYSAITPAPGDAPLRMGTREAEDHRTTSYFLGAIGEVRIWNTALSDNEVYNLYHFNIVPDGVVAEWLLTEETGTTAIDTIGGHNGNIFGAYRPVH
ncbi:MAG TPA: LamG domain-containing protein [Candidatus Binatia bacterium]|nr:LamG domain-containing protein [Candidatus Binatia bacterium]